MLHIQKLGTKNTSWIIERGVYTFCTVPRRTPSLYGESLVRYGTLDYPADIKGESTRPHLH